MAVKHTVLVAFEGMDFERDDAFTAALLDDSIKCYDGTGFDFQTKERHHFFYVTDDVLDFVVRDIHRTFGATGIRGTVTVTRKEENNGAVDEGAGGGSST